MSRRQKNPRARIEAQLARIKAEMDRLDGAIGTAQRERAKLEAEQKTLAAELQRGGAREIKATDHGIVRYLERVKHLIDRDAIEAEMVTDELQGLVDRLGGTGRFPVRTLGCAMILRDYAIVTVTMKDGEETE